MKQGRTSPCEGPKKATANTDFDGSQKGEQVTDIAPNAERRAAKPYEVLAKALTDCSDTTSLFKQANADDFRAASHTLSPAELKKLRELYRQRRDDLDGRTKLEEFDDKVIVITDIRFWHTDKYENNDGNGVTLTFHPEDEPERVCNSLTSSAIVYRFATGACNPAPPTPSDPVRVHIKLAPVRDAERAAKGQRQWQFRELPTLSRANGEEGAPF